ncbi:MAG TPA: type I glyceraldehyde-3-phosphate dehydrogenase [Candidatus Nanoarchaeia archaeon]|nr:type I glyceraldehyde-3-phosphate dehydrogenase [Candidatus Nanoarchaeia archaeon]
MFMNIAINGFGRIGRSAFKAILDKNHPENKIVALNDLTDTKTLAHLLKYDSAYGPYEKKVSHTDKAVVVDGVEYPVFASKDPKTLPWKDLQVDLVIESTGRFTSIEQASAHLQAGAKKVVLTAPSKGDGEMKTIVLGVNEEELKKEDKVFSMASCTTNCLAPMTAVIEKEFGIKKAMMTTTHSYTADQVLVDGPHKDLRRARAAAANIIPTTTGAALAAALTIPALKDKFDGLSLRVPTIVVSICDTVYLLKKKVTAEEINNAIIAASDSDKLRGILTYTNEPLVSTDFIGNPYSSIVDLSLTKVVEGDMVKVVSWYDNEWGYSNRLADIAEYIRKNGLI